MHDGAMTEIVEVEYNGHRYELFFIEDELSSIRMLHTHNGKAWKVIRRVDKRTPLAKTLVNLAHGVRQV